MSVNESSTSIRQIVIEVLGSRINDRSRIDATGAMPTPIRADHESIRRALSVLLQRPESELVGAEVDEIVRGIEDEAMGRADEVGGYLNQLVARLVTLGCTTRQTIVDFFTSADRVLSELYSELQRPRPSPTRLRQISTQYALDPRRRVDVPNHRIMTRRVDDDYEIAIVPPGAAQLSSIPWRGTIVRDPFARQIIDLSMLDPVPYRELMQAIEIALGYVPVATEMDSRQLGPFIPSTAVQVDLDEPAIIVFGRCYVLDLQLVQFMQALLETPGEWVSSTRFANDPLFAGVRIDRRLPNLPVSIQELIESRPRRGYRLRLERLEQLCQNSSVVPEGSPVDDG